MKNTRTKPKIDEVTKEKLPYAFSAVNFIRGTFLKNSLEYLLDKQNDYLFRLNRTVGILAQAKGIGVEEVEALLQSVVEYTLHIIKEQIWFQRTGKYRRSKFSEIRREVYENKELMSNVYLPGLFLTQVFWPIHYFLGKEFRRLLVPHLKADAIYLDAGVGPGHNLLEVLQACSELRALAVDISPYSLEFTKNLIGKVEGTLDRVSFFLEDLAADFHLDLPASVASLGEVLEHVENPDKVLNNLFRSLRPRSPVFITTVIDSGAIDHITQFSSRQEIDDLISLGGFELVERNIVSPSDFGDKEAEGDLTKIYYGLFIRK